MSVVFLGGVSCCLCLRFRCCLLVCGSLVVGFRLCSSVSCLLCVCCRCCSVRFWSWLCFLLGFVACRVSRLLWFRRCLSCCWVLLFSCSLFRRPGPSFVRLVSVCLLGPCLRRCSSFVVCCVAVLVPLSLCRPPCSVRSRLSWPCPCLALVVVPVAFRRRGRWLLGWSACCVVCGFARWFLGRLLSLVVCVASPSSCLWRGGDFFCVCLEHTFISEKIRRKRRRRGSFATLASRRKSASQRLRGAAPAPRPRTAAGRLCGLSNDQFRQKSLGLTLLALKSKK